MRVGLLGFGLIGGSVAQALARREPGAWSLAAWSPTGVGPRAALADDVVDTAAGSPSKAIDGAQLVVLAAPPLACLGLLEKLAGRWRGALSPEAIVTDVASTKRRIVERARELGLLFVGGHPMAGRETSGYGAADPDLFVGRPWIVCPDGETAAAIGVVERLAEAAGASPLRMAAADHDAAAAAISHLPLLVSAALVEAVLGGSGGQETQKGETSRTQASGTEAGLAAIRSLAASGWRDATRLAGGDPQMGAGIAVTNADELAARARALREVLDAWLVELERPGGPDADRIEARLATARSLLVAEPRVDGR